MRATTRPLAPSYVPIYRHPSTPQTEPTSIDALKPSFSDWDEPDWDALEPAGFYAQRSKRWLSLTLIAIALPIVAAVIVGVALLNALQFRSFRRVFFVQWRIGRRGVPFRMFKFRTMRDAQDRGSIGQFRSWSLGLDRARVTPLGRILRKTHLDELPQLWNVVRGEMCLIGPRPEMTEIETWARDEVPEFSHRLVLRPGITGIAQVTQGYTPRDVDAYREKARLNDTYRQSLTFWADIGLLFRTAIWMMACRGWKWSPPSSSPP